MGASVASAWGSQKVIGRDWYTSIAMASSVRASCCLLILG
jgi:hypothetical protein